MSTEPETITTEQAHGQCDQPLLLLRGKRIVVCENEALILMQLRRLLVQAGLTIVGMANNGQEGLKLVLRERPEIVLMDVGMAVVDGFEATRRILAAYNVCIILLTGYADVEFEAEAAILGISGYVVKPFTSDVLMPRVMELFARFCARQ